MDNLAEEMDQVMSRLQRAGMARCAPKLNPKGDPAKPEPEPGLGRMRAAYAESSKN